MKRRDFINACIAGTGGALGASAAWLWLPRKKDVYSRIVDFPVIFSDALCKNQGVSLSYSVAFISPQDATFKLAINQNGKPITLATRVAKAGLINNLKGDKTLSLIHGDEIGAISLTVDRPMTGPLELLAVDISIGALPSNP